MTIVGRHRLDVRFRDCDMLGHVNNAVYLTYLEQARIELWRAQFGLTRSPVEPGEKRGAGFILARTEVDFRAQARYADTLEVRTAVAAVGRSSLTYDAEIVRVADGAVVTQSKAVVVWFDYDTNRSVPIDDALKAKLLQPITGA